MSVKEHYNNHLQNFYSWMIGDFETKQKEQQKFFEDNMVTPKSNKIAIDLGAGNGLQSISLSNLGFKVTAIDFNKKLLDELKNNSKELDITVIKDDIKNIKNYSDLNPELILCCGDTITHLDSINEIENFIVAISKILSKDGVFILSFRDYSNELIDIDRFIPVKSDDTRILTCFLEYEESHVRVTDLLYEKENNEWKQKVSSYKKVRISNDCILEILTKNGFNIVFNSNLNRQEILVCKKY